MFFLEKISSVYRKCTVFQLLFKTNSYFCWLSFLHSVWVQKPKKWQQPVADHFDGSEDFFSELFFWILIWRASKEHFNTFGTKSNLKCSPSTSKATNGYFGQSHWNWMKRHVPRFEKIRPDANNKNYMEQDGNNKKEKRHSTLKKKLVEHKDSASEWTCPP